METEAKIDRDRDGVEAETDGGEDRQMEWRQTEMKIGR